MLTNAEKAVLFLLSLDEATARPVVEELSEEDIKKLRAVASTMREVPKDAIGNTFREFLDRSGEAIAVPRGGLPYLRRLSANALGEERARAVFEDGAFSPLTRLEHAPADDVATLLENEPPQLAAAILSLLPPKSASPILFAMSDDKQAHVVKHIGKMTQIPARVLEDVATALAENLPSADATTLVSVDGVAKAAELLNGTARAAQDQILGAIELDDPTLAQTVRQAMFTFEDMKKLDSRAMRTILREVATERLVVALKGASQEVLTAVLAALSGRAGELLRDDLESLGNVKKAEIEAARKEILTTVLRLEGEGQVDLGRGGEEA